jgi:hypothetical protein
VHDATTLGPFSVPQVPASSVVEAGAQAPLVGTQAVSLLPLALVTESQVSPASQALSSQ